MSLHLGSSFCNLHLYEGNRLVRENSNVNSKTKKPSAQESQNLAIKNQWVYMSGQSPQSAIKNFLKDVEQPIGQVIISCRHLDKILNTKLGGSVAQVVSRGFENWSLLRQPIKSKHFEIHPSRSEALASQEHIFGVNERVSADGKILQALDLSELEAISSKLKLHGIKKVCVNFLFAHKNPAHTEQAKKYFQEQEFDVFCNTEKSLSEDEIPVWRKNTLNACLTGTFDELTAEVKKTFADLNQTPEVLFVLDNNQLSSVDRNEVSSTVFGWLHCVSNRIPEKSDALYLGLENWWFIQPELKTNHWNGPWGMVEANLPSHNKLQIQPTSELKINFFNEFDFSSDELDYQPGPMCFGRALRPMVIDVLQIEKLIALPWAQASGEKKYLESLKSILKSQLQRNDLSAEQLNSQLAKQFIQQIATELNLYSNKNKIWLTGYYAPYLHKHIQAKLPHIEIQLDPQAQQAEAYAAHLRGHHG